jgi:hypothetical protein
MLPISRKIWLYVVWSVDFKACAKLAGALEEEGYYVFFKEKNKYY